MKRENGCALLIMVIGLIIVSIMAIITINKLSDIAQQTATLAAEVQKQCYEAAKVNLNIKCNKDPK